MKNGVGGVDGTSFIVSGFYFTPGQTDRPDAFVDALNQNGAQY